MRIPSSNRRSERAADQPGTPKELSVFATYRPLFHGQGPSLVAISVLSFLAGIAEGLLLVMVANIALTIGSNASDAGTIEASLGPLSSLQFSLESSFVIALILAFARFGLQMLTSHISATVTAKLTAEMRAGTFRDYAGASWTEQASHAESDIQDLLLRHVNRVTSSIGVMANAVSYACTLAALIVSAIFIDPVSAVLLAVSGAALFWFIRPLTGVAKRVSRQSQEAGLAYSQRSLEAIGTSLEVRAFGVTEPVTERLAEATAAEIRPTYSGMILRQLVMSLYQGATILLLLGGLFATYTFLDQPLASLGAIVVILIRALNQTSAIQSAYHSIGEAGPFLERLEAERAKFRAAKPRSGDVHIGSPGRLRFEDVSYSYIPGTSALRDVSFEVQFGEAIGIIGPSGSGKSTLIQLLLRLREPTAGRFLIDDTDANDVVEHDWFDNVALVPQDSRVINGTVRDNIAFYREATEDQIVSAAKRAHIHDEILAMPDGYDTDLGTRGGAVSGGQRQRISIARALLRKPSILVLDEPTSALDMRSEALVHETFTDLKGSVTIFAIAHRLSTLNTCDRIMVMQDGELQAFGARQELEADSDFYRDALRLSKIRS
ncbi:MAG: transporter permease [Ilumatobacteraceae bacterium]|nr:transporter permease [Ilumatobacteraceae bacterium]